MLCEANDGDDETFVEGMGNDDDSGTEAQTRGRQWWAFPKRTVPTRWTRQVAASPLTPFRAATPTRNVISIHHETPSERP